MLEVTETAVRRGSALLDKVAPGWRDQISPAELAMGRCDRCVVGQVAGFGFLPMRLHTTADWTAYRNVSERYDALLREWGGMEQFVHGFLPDEGETWEGLRDAWIGCIKGEWS